KPIVKPIIKPEIKPVVNNNIKATGNNNTTKITVKDDKGNIIKTKDITGEVGKDIPNVTLPNNSKVLGIVDNGKVINAVPKALSEGNHNVVVIVKENNNDLGNLSGVTGTSNGVQNTNNNENISEKTNPKTGDSNSLPYIFTIGVAGALLGLLKRKDKTIKNENK
uniref:hypothetical protein n=1 Tax=uncultured Clostridium sp. TaxID=59620 RepID=UPI002621C9DF